MRFESPQVIAGSPEARLDFIGHAQPSSRTDFPEGRGEVARGRNHDAVAAQDQIEVEGGRRKAPGGQGCDGVVEARRVAVRVSGIVPAELPPVTIRCGDRGDVFGERSAFVNSIIRRGRVRKPRRWCRDRHPPSRCRRRFPYALWRDARRDRWLRFPSIRTCRPKDHRAWLR